MPLSQSIVLDKIEINELGIIMVRYGRKIMDDDGITEITRTYNRVSFTPGMVLNSIPQGVIRAICSLIWTPAVISAYNAYLASLPKL